MLLIFWQGIFSFIEGLVFLFIFVEKFQIIGLFIEPNVVSWMGMIGLGLTGYLAHCTSSYLTEQCDQIIGI